jgi:hypothetical protein
MATIWLHKVTGCDFLVSFDKKVDALEFCTKIFDKAFAVNGEEVHYSLDEMGVGGILMTKQEIPADGIFVGQVSNLQAFILPDCVPSRMKEGRTRYDKIAYVWPDDALAMVFEKEPAHFYGFPSGFQVLDREEPYNFTKYIPSKYELDEELADYMMIV